MKINTILSNSSEIRININSDSIIVEGMRDTFSSFAELDKFIYTLKQASFNAQINGNTNSTNK
jgi:hypothetical protein